jgi:hypothetical protein
MIMKGKYDFLSNFYPCTLQYMGITYQNSEAAFQAQKCPERAIEFANLDPSRAKRLGRRVKLRSDWEEVKIPIMYQILEAKFSNPELMNRLLQVEGEIVEETTWGDTFWGVCKSKGNNMLGKLLMDIRDRNKTMC